MSIHDDKSQSITRRAGLITAIVSMPWMILLGYFGEMERGILAYCSSGVLLLVGWFYWNFKNRLWYWGCLTIFTISHIAFVALIPEVRFKYAALMIPIFIVDFVILAQIMGAVGDKAEEALPPQ